MCPDKIIRRFAGSFILLSVALGMFVHPAWFWFTAFVGFNLVQSSFTNICPLDMILSAGRLFGCGKHQKA